MSGGIKLPRDIPVRQTEDAYEALRTNADNVISLDSVRNPTPAALTGLPLTYFDDVEKSLNKNWLMKGVIAKHETSMWIAPPGKL